MSSHYYNNSNRCKMANLIIFSAAVDHLTVKYRFEIICGYCIRVQLCYIRVSVYGLYLYVHYCKTQYNLREQ